MQVKHLKPARSGSQAICFVLVFPLKSTSATDIPCPKIPAPSVLWGFPSGYLSEGDIR